jgi:uncharacterized protein YyaL (SSP411 family)
MSKKSKSKIGLKKPNKRPNRLINEKSPYLLQHAYNPVNWYPWGDEAFEKAAKEDKPIFLSIGYSTCHWCHVMEHESFEDLDIAKLMNDTFISVKVDREERPDIDNLYMNVCQAITGGGGWPLTIFLTPEKKPFYAGTYIPKEPRFDQPGLNKLIKAIDNMWHTQRSELISSAENVITTLKNSVTTTHGNDLEDKILNSAFKQLSNRYEPEFGGFGTAPKFPEPHILMFLLRYWHRTGELQALKMVENTLIKMRQGGIFDHIGFGYHRYSTDRHWLVPHFEKMLYDQALLAMAYIECYQATSNDFYKDVASEIFEYVLRNMRSEDGGFYSAEDADSEGEEGKFYTWSLDELKNVLNRSELEFINRVFNVEEYGNFIDFVQRKKTGRNILHLIESKEKLSQYFGFSKKQFSAKLERIRKKLFSARESRKHPHKDDKILTDWNGLMIAALAKGGQAFNDLKLTNAAIKSMKFILDNLHKSENRLLHRFRDGEAAIPGFLNDYSYLTWGLIELYETTFDKQYLKFAEDLTNYILEHFKDFKNGGLYFTSDENEELILRNKESYDGALPSGNSIAFNNLIRLSRLTANHIYEESAYELVRGISQIVKRAPVAHTMLLSGYDFVYGRSYEILIEGDLKNKDTQKVINTLRNNFIPNKIVHLNYNPKSKADANDILFKLPDPGKQQKTKSKEPVIYICENYSCQKPTTDITEALKQLGVRKPE